MADERSLDPRRGLGALRWSTVRDLIRERLRLLRLLGTAKPAALIGLVLTGAVTAIAAPLTALATGWFVARLGGPAVTSALVLLVVAVFARQVSFPLAELLSTWAARDIDGEMRSTIRRIAGAPRGIGHLVDPAFVDDAARASDLGETWRMRSAGMAAVGQHTFLVRLAGAIGSAVVLAAYFPALAVGLLVATLAMRAILRRQWTELVRHGDELVGVQRQTRYWTDLAIGAEAAKEVRLFGIGGWITDRRLDSYLSWASLLGTHTRVVLRGQGPVVALAAGSAAAALLVPGLAAARGTLGPDAVATCLVAAWGIFFVGGVGQEAFDIEYGAAGVRALDRLTARYGDARHGDARNPVSAGAGVVAGPCAVRFTDVRFAYPASSTPVHDGLTLDIRPGEVLAIVGTNGAGKTTLTKLLAGLHPPTSGRITVDGVDLRTLDMTAWRRQVGVVFQDFVHYPSTLRDNIRLAAPEVPADDAEIMDAVCRAGAEDLVAALPDGLDTALWRSDAGGTNLSGGQWQKVAITRALYSVAHGRRILVLDEPTAHLDVHAEASFYERVVAAVPGVSVVLISHRLSTVRGADRIVVLRAGAIVESGTHADLLAADGEYARLFRLQAARFAETS